MATTRESFNQPLNGCYRFVPCLADPGRRSALGLKAALLMLHVIYVGVLFLFDNDLIQNMKQRPWYTGLYLLLLLVTLVQYFFTSGSLPGYVIDAMRSWDDKNAAFTRESAPSKQHASSKNRSLGIDVAESQTARSFVGSNMTSWAKLVLDMYPPGTFARSISCSYCHIEQPPRAKHCHDCDKCVLQFDHHCVWLGTCIGQRNHCRFWWYICEETALSIWTAIMYIICLKEDAAGVWWKAGIMIVLLITLFFLLIFLLLLLFFHSYLVLTNQTTYELVRHRRIPYFSGIPDQVYPFSQGICRNLYNFCCASSRAYNMERLPTAIELEELSRPYTCSDCLTCRCC